jgi:cytochrome c peroxidase
VVCIFVVVKILTDGFFFLKKTIGKSNEMPISCVLSRIYRTLKFLNIRTMQKFTFLLALGSALAFSACLKNSPDIEYTYYHEQDYAMMSQYINIPELPYQYTEDLSAVGMFVDPASVDPAKVVLGRVLFYDKKLSKDGTVSCASCHKQELAFGDDRAVSLGVQQRQGERNSIALMSVTSFASQYGTNTFTGTGKRFFWDNRVGTAAEQAAESMANPKEMDMTMQEIVQMVDQQPYYRPLLRKAFGDEGVNETRVLEAVSSFVNAMSSASSFYDEAVADARAKNQFGLGTNPLPMFDFAQNVGKGLYIQHCGSCHVLENLLPLNPVLDESASNGLDQNPTDVGVFKFTNNYKQKGTFKIPGLRNIMRTAPYMHDGRFATIDQVLDHYATGIQNHENLHPTLRDANGNPVKIALTGEERGALIAFLNTLTDEKKIADVRFADPFK